ncbi:GNAT family N-acetyltransferase [uncultured Sphaerochaeta sp.]|uniref:GNAT family N-acetyltransferase n=1 Tax=uncultured Sphaerochaeta sp. TaxID=886478 RepID=UPI002A0A1BDF|nr:GNAT family N-acetyltransferase [uncultured Sphaerochaeta sp.]
MNEVMEILAKQGILEHIDMLEVLRQGRADVVQADDFGVLLKVSREGAWLLSVFEETATERFVAQIVHDDSPVCSHQRFSVPFLEAARFHPDIVCCQAAYLKKDLFPLEPDQQFKPLTLAEEPLVQEHYQRESPAYIHERIVSGVLEGIYCEGVLAGFMGLHEEGSLGMLVIFPEFRRRGLALALERHYCNRLLGQGKIPYCHIIKGNTASLALHEKLGFTLAQSEITWFF